MLWLAFFYTRPVLVTASGDALFVSLTRPTLGLLAAPAHRPQQVPPMPRAILDPKVRGDHFSLSRDTAAHLPLKR